MINGNALYNVQVARIKNLGRNVKSFCTDFLKFCDWALGLESLVKRLNKKSVKRDRKVTRR